MRNLITDVAGLRVGSAQDAALGSGVTALIFDAPATASISISGGGPGLRDAALLEPDMTVQQIDALVLSGGSAFGLDSAGGVQAFFARKLDGACWSPTSWCRWRRARSCSIWPMAATKAGKASRPIGRLGHEAAQAAALDFALGSHGAGLGATLVDLKGGLGSASAVTSQGFVVGALVAVNAVGQATIGESQNFWAAPYERGGEYGGLGWPSVIPRDSAGLAHKRRGAAKHHHRHRRHRRRSDQGAGQTAGDHGAERHVARLAARPCGP